MMVFSTMYCIHDEARADWAQSLGMSERSIALGGAFTAIADDYSVFYTNPAGATNFDESVLGMNLRFIDLTHPNIIDETGDHNVDRSNTKSDFAIVPTIAGYYPVNDRFVIGLGFGSPFAITANPENESGFHRYNATDLSIITVDLAPTIAFKINNKLSLGAALNIVAFKQFRIETLIGDGFLGQAGDFALNSNMGGFDGLTINGEDDGIVELETDDSFFLPGTPFKFDPGWEEFSYTLGVQYKVNERFRIGLAYRGETPTTFEGKTRLRLSSIDAAIVSGLGIPGEQIVNYEMDLHIPRHLQGGFAFAVIPDKLIWSLDAQWTNWGNADGLGSPINVKLDGGGLVQLPLVGGIKNIVIDFNTHDTVTLRTGLQYQINPKTQFLAGYVYDPSFIDNDTANAILYSSDRHIGTLGLTHDFRPGQKNSGFVVSAGLQGIFYEERNIQAGESSVLGGLSQYNSPSTYSTLTFASNIDQFPRTNGIPITGAMEFGGFIWGAGISLSYVY